MPSLSDNQKPSQIKMVQDLIESLENKRQELNAQRTDLQKARKLLKATSDQGKLSGKA